MDERERRKQFLLLQINDALFPIGAYAHSYGLETCIQKNLVSSAEEAGDYIRRRMLYGFCYNELLTAKLAYRYAAAESLSKLRRLDELLEASRIPRETREAGKKLGSRFVKTVQNMDIPYETNMFYRYCTYEEKRLPQHAAVYGVFCAATGISYEASIIHYLYAQTSAMVTNCVKTVPLSQTAGQRLLYQSQAFFQELLERLEALTEEDLCLSMPGFDIRCMQHEGLYSRIYMS